MTKPTLSIADLRALADLIEKFNQLFFDDRGEYVIEADVESFLDFSDIVINQSGRVIGRAVFEDGWIGFQHD